MHEYKDPWLVSVLQPLALLNLVGACVSIIAGFMFSGGWFYAAGGAGTSAILFYVLAEIISLLSRSVHGLAVIAVLLDERSAATKEIGEQTLYDVQRIAAATMAAHNIKEID